MKAMKRKAELGRIWKIYGETSENRGTLPWNINKKRQAVDLSIGFTIINIMNDKIYDVLNH
jgi:hypothetical protein